MYEDRPIVLASALRHNVDEADARLAFAVAVVSIDAGDGMVMHVGADRSGRWLEVGVVSWGDDVAIVHAMPARPKFLREVR